MAMEFLGVPFEAGDIESLHLVREFNGKKFHIVIGSESEDEAAPDDDTRITGFHREEAIEMDDPDLDFEDEVED